MHGLFPNSRSFQTRGLCFLWQVEILENKCDTFLQCMELQERESMSFWCGKVSCLPDEKQVAGGNAEMISACESCFRDCGICDWMVCVCVWLKGVLYAGMLCQYRNFNRENDDEPVDSGPIFHKPTAASGGQNMLQYHFFTCQPPLSW